jgi:hypothetical protein
MALELNGTTGVSLVQDGVVTAGDLASTLDLTGKTVTLPAGTGGKVLQVVQTTMTNSFQSSSSNGSYDITGLSVSITPSSASSKILMLAMVAATAGTTDYRGGLLLVRNSTDLFIGDAWSTRPRLTVAFGSHSNGNNQIPPSFISYLDSPSTTSSTTYKIKAVVIDGVSIYVNRSGNNPDSSSVGLGVSSITVMEIAA